jgi:stage II sporulation protein R
MGMKKVMMIVISLIFIVAGAYLVYNNSDGGGAENEYFRLHIRANSNSADDQAVKYKVRDKVVEFLTPYAAQCTDKDRAQAIIGSILPQIEDVCDSVLSDNGYYYGARAEIRTENFPTRVYDDLTLEAGVYDALIIELGSGSGDNWWCVIYPPLCFTGGTSSVTYRSVIYDIIKRFYS